MEWRIKRIFNFTENKSWEQGFVKFGFHGKRGTQYFLDYNEHWLGCITAEDEFIWTAGAADKGLSRNHIPFEAKYPHYIAELPDGSLLVSSNGTNEVFKIRPDKKSAELFINTKRIGLKDIGNCVYDEQGYIWVNEIEGCRVWKFNLAGEPVLTLGNGHPGFQGETVPFEAVQFNWIYDMRLGPDANMYVLDSKNFSVRRINVNQGTVSTVVGTGEPGYSGDGELAHTATLGSNPDEYFDGPFSISLDEEGNIFIGDTYNHVVRMVDHSTRQISTIVGKHHAESNQRNNPLETDPYKINLPKICSMDYHAGCLFIPDWSDDLIVVEKRR
ncbi:MAG: hypothetical protein IT308_02755 [Anaerolineaceae bacterium]|nr:hypothetical protein [Anaerolineaceae bacterium]